MALDIGANRGIVLPYMASLITKKKGHKLYYYVVDSARVDGQPRIVHQTYLGSAEKLAALVKDRTAPVPVAATVRDVGVPGALWRAATDSGVFDVLTALWPTPRSGPSIAHYLLLAAIHRVCQPGPKTDIAAWYDRTILPTLWHLPAARFTSQAVWDAFDQIAVAEADADTPDDLQEAQQRLLTTWQAKHLVSQRVLAYDTTNFYTYIASTNTRTRLAQRDHNKQGRHNLRQVGLTYLLDGERGLSLCHHVYPGNVADAAELPAVLPRVTHLLDEAKIPRESVTLVFDKGTAALTNTVALREAGVGWVSALPWNQAPPDLRTRPIEDLPACSADHPGVRAAGQLAVVHGEEALCVLQYSAAFASEQLHSLTTSLTTVLQRLRRLASDLRKPGCRLTEAQVRGRIDRWLSPAFLPEIVRWEWRVEAGHGRLQFDVDHRGLQQILAERLGRTVLITNRRDWSAEQVVAAYGGQQQLEQVFRGLKDGDWLGWGPMHHWTDSKIRVHAFYCMLGISLLKYLQREAQAAWPGLSVDQLLEELRAIQQVVLLYPPQGEKGPRRTASVLTKQTLPQQLLATTLGLDRVSLTPRG
ncbi:MAG: IS1634 family transposase [Acidobacteria bacterium]|nr:IS1634 family transposase [Acidobacteriota bacterium]